ncbi:MAG: DUF2071 domain-containing protein [Planctomycetota bacterium]
MARPFLTATWADLILANFTVPDHLLLRRLPRGIELDRFHGSACASLVGFRFLDCRVFGVKWPLHVNFPEFNLRFYVRHTESNRRGVMFVREFVPRRAIAAIANLTYNEPYAFTPMTEHQARFAAERKIRLNFFVQGRRQSIATISREAPVTPLPTSDDHFFKERQWGFGVTRSGRTLTYEVNHPVWRVYPVTSHAIDIDWTLLYGKPWGVMQHAKPVSVIHAEGSRVEVQPLKTS